MGTDDLICRKYYDMSWVKQENEQLGVELFIKELYKNPGTGLLIELVKFPAGKVTRPHRHTCGQGMFVLSGTLHTHEGNYGPGSFVWYPAGAVSFHGAGDEDDLTAVVIFDGPADTQPGEITFPRCNLIYRDSQRLYWGAKTDPATGHVTFSKDLYFDEKSGLWIKLTKYPAGTVTPLHRHNCGHGMMPLSGLLHTHKGDYAPGTFVWYPEGNLAEHGAVPDEDLIDLFIIDKPFDIEYV
ncbi:MAG: cupin domain-containing protein [Lachnospiraceae bacterium]|jgi:quercetin dioxygenase-like cupin family protein